MNIRKISIIVILILFLIFIFQNIQSVTVSFLTISVSMPRALLLSITLFVGILIGIFIPRDRWKKNLQ